MFNHTMLKRSLAIGLALGASAVPVAANARVIVPGDAGLGGATTQAHHAGASSAAPRPSAVTGVTKSQSAGGFQWDDAGIGAGAAIALLGAGGIATVGLRRRQTHQSALS
jgi:hypothetical protein